MNTAVYRRVSTDHQDNSLILQEQRVADYCQFKGLTTTPDLTFADPDTSGRTPMRERMGGRALMNRLQHGDVKHIVVAKLDRLGRNVKDALGVLETFKQHGVTLHIVDLAGESITTQGHMGKLMLTVMLAVSEWEVEEIRDRVTKQLRKRFDDLQLTGNVPFGYDCNYTFADSTQHLSPKALSAAELQLISAAPVISKPLIANHAEQGTIRWMAQMRAAKHSLKSIADSLNAQGIRTKLGRPWQCGSVDGVLNSRHTARLLSQSDSDQDQLAA
jgi:DNA invertase Pin-like site-specific DNA recombinase